MTEDFLLELRSEEIPARMQERAREDLAKLFEARLNALNLPFTGIESFATPRRLALIVRGVAETTSAATEERKGPRADAPAQAIEASHIFNLLQARGVISVAERQAYIGRVRDLAKGSCEAWIAHMTPTWNAQYPEWTI